MGMKSVIVAMAWGLALPALAQARGGLVVCVGDSITYGSGTSNPATEAYPVQLASMARQTDPAWKVVNFGLGGTTLLRRGDKPYVNEGVYKGVLASAPDLITIMLGTNDSKPWNWVYKADFVSDYSDLIDTFRALPGRPQVWICRPVPAAYENFSIRPDVIRDEIGPLVEQIGRDKGVLVIDLYTPLADHLDLFPDGIHPDAAGARRIAQTLLPYLLNRPLVRDFSQDGVVNWLDFARLAQRWRELEPSLDIAPPAGDGAVTPLDLAEWCAYWMAYPGLVAHWQLDETTGDLAADRLGLFDGTLHGSPVWRPASGVRGGALDLDGVDDFVSTGAVLKPGDGPFTVFLWVKGGGPGQVILSQSYPSGQGVVWLSTDAATGLLRTDLTDKGRFTTALLSGATVTDGAWHSIRLVWDGAHRSLFVDDQEVAADTRDLGKLGESTAGLCLGAGQGFKAGTFWRGLVDDVRFYNRAVRP